ncbi:MAG TPA: PqqD family peptide modification chaperone [Solirubrobacterales bacterium]|nr:PqqD family peptide modification chaperone [Solirubrobacterales bacterium]
MRRREDSFTLGRLLWRLGRRPPRSLLAAPERPIGAKLEITYACNLRCGFCYTDSPRHTLQRTAELSDDEWRQVVRESLDLGIVEAVVTGGEPFLRRELTLELIETLSSAGAGVTLNTNGWFVDEEVASRLGALAGVTAHVSLDGARAGLHDGSRGVPGSWRRAVEGIDQLLGAGVGVCVVHVVTPGNEDGVPDFLEQMWTLGVPWVRMTPVVVTGAAARGGEWKVSRRARDGAAEDFRRRRGEVMRIQVQPGTGGGLSLQGRAAPGSFLVRPNGDVRPDSLRPFRFGNAIRDGVETCWAAIREGWDDERINRWADAMKGPEDLRKSDLIAYLDDELSLVGGQSGPPRRNGGGSGESGPTDLSKPTRSGREAKVPEPTPPPAVDPAQELLEARAKVRELAGRRRYRHAPLRWSGSPRQRFVRLVGDGSYLRLNESGSVIMDALDGGTLADAAGALRARYDIDEERARADAVTTTRELLKRGVVVAADASGSFPAEPGTSDLPGSEPNG